MNVYLNGIGDPDPDLYECGLWAKRNGEACLAGLQEIESREARVEAAGRDKIDGVICHIYQAGRDERISYMICQWKDGERTRRPDLSVVKTKIGRFDIDMGVGNGIRNKKNGWELEMRAKRRGKARTREEKASACALWHLHLHLHLHLHFILILILIRYLKRRPQAREQGIVASLGMGAS